MGKHYGVLACDIGASGGRIHYITYDSVSRKLCTAELSRFSNGAVRLGNCLLWDFISLYRGVIEGLQEAVKHGVHGDSLGIDTWGNDFALLDREGRMLENPYCYRDVRTEGMMEFVDTLIGPERLYQKNGVQFARFNTLYQLASLAKERGAFLETAEKMLFIPDLLAFYLTGAVSAEYTLASISQLYNHHIQNWDQELPGLLGIPKRLLPPIVMPGESKGCLRKEICEKYKLPPLPVISVGGHDTASAVVAVPQPDGQAVYISSGTWSIMGIEIDAPILSEKARKLNFANEGGVGGKIRFSKNIMGLWLIQELRRSFFQQGREYTYAQMEQQARQSKPFALLLDPDTPDFYEPGNMVEKIKQYARQTGQKPPEAPGEMIRSIEEGLAFRYRYTLEQLEDLTGRTYPSLTVVGGGSKEGLLCQMTADCCGCRVQAGLSHATSAGNAITQLIALGAVSGLEEAREILRLNHDMKIYDPQKDLSWEQKYREFLSLIT